MSQNTINEEITCSDLVSAVEVALRQVSDGLCSETKEQMSAQGLSPGATARIISTVSYHMNQF